MSKATRSRQSYLYNIFFTTPSMQIMLSIYLNSRTCKYISLDNGVTMTSKRRENINLVSFICISFLVIMNWQPNRNKNKNLDYPNETHLNSRENPLLPQAAQALVVKSYYISLFYMITLLKKIFMRTFSS